jgi:uncharacterized protein (DUF58 family)
VRRIEVQARRLALGAAAGGYASAFRGAGLEFEGTREYTPGDDPRRVDWNVTARTGRLHVKTFVAERDLTVLVVADLSAAADAGFGAWSFRQAAARVAACVVIPAAAAGDRVGFVPAGVGLRQIVAPGKGAAHARRIVRDALVLRAAGGARDLAPALRRVARLLRRHALVFVVSDFLGGGWERPLARLARRHDVVAVRLLLPDLDPPGRGLVRLADPGCAGAWTLDWGHAPTREAFRREVEAWRRGSAEGLRRAGADLLDLPIPRDPSPDAVVRPMLAYFHRRAARGRRP